MRRDRLPVFSHSRLACFVAIQKVARTLLDLSRSYCLDYQRSLENPRTYTHEIKTWIFTFVSQTWITLPKRLTLTESLKPCLMKHIMLIMFVPIPKTSISWQMTVSITHWQMLVAWSLGNASISMSVTFCRLYVVNFVPATLTETEGMECVYIQGLKGRFFQSNSFNCSVRLPNNCAIIIYKSSENRNCRVFDSVVIN